MNARPLHIALAFSGASGAAYFTRLVERLGVISDVRLHLLITEGGRRVLQVEEGLSWPLSLPDGATIHANKDIGASLASGSFLLHGMVVVPCSMNTVAAVAAGLAGNLVTRCAAVQLKERRKLILVPRETPLSLPNLRAMTAVCEAGAVVLPASPGFYHKPQTVTDLVDTVVDRIIDQLGVDDKNIKRWDP